MTATALSHQIESLPDDLRQEVADFVAFLKLKRLGIQPDESDLTEEECNELDRRWAEYEAEPSAAADAFSTMKTLRAGYGL